jgi:hypothetical protein
MTVSGEPSSVRRPRLWPLFVTFAVGAPVAIIAVVGLGPILRGNADFVTLPAVLVGAVLVAARPADARGVSSAARAGLGGRLGGQRAGNSRPLASAGNEKDIADWTDAIEKEERMNAMPAECP